MDSDLEGEVARAGGSGSATAPVEKRVGARRGLFVLIAIGLGALLIIAGIRTLSYLRSYETTDDAQVDGHIAAVSSRIDGTIAHVYVQETQSVAEGQLLAEIDPRDYDVAVETARSNLAQAVAQVEAAKADYQVTQSRLRQSQATSAKASSDEGRYSSLFRRGVSAKAEYEESVKAANVAAAAVDADQASVQAAFTGIALREAAVRSAQSALDQALLNRTYTQIFAPMKGVIGKKTVEVGQRVQPGEGLLAVVALDDIWITANFKETQIRRMRPGLNATIHVDALGRNFSGYVEGMAGASGEKYSVMPPENATGNYVKVVQRMPIRIRLRSHSSGDGLRPGMSVEPTVWLR
jgi:membrane fusion protein (multidrug efflux system)